MDMLRAHHRTAHRARPWAILVSSGLASVATSQTTIYVNGVCGDDAWSGANQTCQAPDGPKASIQAAINAAVNGNTVLVAMGTYAERIDFLGKGIAVRAAGAATIDGGGTGAVVTFASGEGATSILEGFTITGGDSAPPVAGSGIRVQSASPTIRACVLTGNRSGLSTGSGGGMWINSGSPLIDGCTITENRGYDGGGGIYVQSGSPRIVRCVIDRNTCTAGSGSGGGIAAQSASLLIQGCTISGNLAGATGVGGGVSLVACQTTMDGCSVLSNNVDRAGGLDVSGGSLRFLRGTIAHNSAGFDGGLRLYGGATATIYNSLICRNVMALGGCSAVRVDDATAALVNCTVTHNTSGAAGFAVGSPPGAAVLSNCILWGNQSALGQAHGATITHSDVQGGYPGEGNIDADPLFASPVADDFTLQGTSACIDAATMPPRLRVSSPIGPLMPGSLTRRSRTQGTGLPPLWIWGASNPARRRSATRTSTPARPLRP
jgi:hypothetical protein